VTFGRRSTARQRRLAWLAWITICVVWGTSFAAVKISLETIPPFFVGGIRYVLGGVLLAAALVVKGEPLPPSSQWPALAVTGGLMFLVGNGGVIWGVMVVPTGLTAVLVGTSPFWMAGLDALFREGKQLFLRQWVGLLLGFAGIAHLVWPDVTIGGVTGQRFALGVLAVQVGCLGWSAGSLYTRYRVPPGNVLGSASLQMVFGGLLMVVAGFLRGEGGAMSLTTDTTLAMVYLTVVGSVLGFAAFSYAMQHLDVAIVSLYTYVNPVVAVVVGSVVLDESFRPRMLVAAAIIIVGILVVGPTGRTTHDESARPLPE
jgi:drug/metabolite transporter (DMT)-like permease